MAKSSKNGTKGDAAEPKNTGGRKKVFIILFIAALILELTVFNYRTLRAVFRSSSGEGEKIYNGFVINGKTEYTVSIPNINKHIDNIYIDIDTMQEGEPSKDKVKLELKVTDDGNKELIKLPERSIVTNVEATKYIPLQLKGESEKIEIHFKDIKNANYIANGVYINKIPPYKFSIIRLLFVYFVFCCLYMLRIKSGFYASQLNFKSDKQAVTVLAIVLVICLMSILFCQYNFKWSAETVSHQQQYNELAEAFADGHFYLNEEPAQALKELENPYDTTARKAALEKAKQSYRWDHAYYEGKYYVYFGVTPELLLYYPAKVFFNTEIRNNQAVALAAVVFVPAAFWLVYLLIKRCRIQIPFIVYCMLGTAFVFAGGMPAAASYADMYHVPIAFGLTLSVLGLALIIYADDILEKSKKMSAAMFFFGALCMALVSGCRPQMLLGSFLLIPLLWDTVFKKRLLFSKQSILQTAAFLLPYIAVAAFMMYYNYARFGSPFDFGANYNLTTNDMTARGFNIARIPLGIFTYMFQPPIVTAEFPFIHSPRIYTAYQGVTVYETTAGGVFVTCWFTAFSLFIGRTAKRLKETKLFWIAVLSLVFAFVIAVADAEMAGLLERYTMDFSWLLLISSVLVFASLLGECGGEDAVCVYRKNMLLNVFSVSFVLTMLFCAANIMMTRGYSFYNSTPQLYFSIFYGLCFWM